MRIVHPLLAVPRRLLTYLGSTLVLGLLLTVLLAQWAGHDVVSLLRIGLPLGVLLGFGALTSWYAVRAVPRPADDPLRAATTLGGTILAGVAAWLALALGWAWLLDRVSARQDALALLSGFWPILLLVGLLVHGVALLLHYLLATLERSQAAERRALEAVALAHEAELVSLRTQLAPHFLFNSLNSIAALAGSQPEAAREMCALLAKFFRQSLALGGEKRIPLGAELELAETYLAVERARFGERLRSFVEAPVEVHGVAVPPLLLQPLVENAVHHGIAHLLDGGVVRIDVRATNGEVRIRVTNPCDPDRPAARGQGVGLNNVRARLRNLFGRRAALLVESAEDEFRVEVRLPREAGD